ncbi:hypothetical protein [Dysgonomonas reticulitermitis]
MTKYRFMTDKEIEEKKERDRQNKRGWRIILTIIVIVIILGNTVGAAITIGICFLAVIIYAIIMYNLYGNRDK